MTQETKLMAKFVDEMKTEASDEYKKIEAYNLCMETIPKDKLVSCSAEIKFREFCKLLDIKKMYGDLGGFY